MWGAARSVGSGRPWAGSTDMGLTQVFVGGFDEAMKNLIPRWHRLKHALPLATNILPTEPDLPTEFGEEIWAVAPIAAKQHSDLLVTEADRLRDSGDAGGAAALYQAVLGFCSWRTDLTVQLGNMLKDTGRLPEAERAYRSALIESPDDADIHLQLGHVLKLMGRRPAALACYETALRLDGTLQAAHLELVQAGSIPHQRQGIAAQLRGHGIERMLTISSQLVDIRAQIDHIGRSLPDLATWTAIPADDYPLFRRLFDVPSPPPPATGGIRPVFRVLVMADMMPVDRLHAQLSALIGQQSDGWEAVFVGAEPSRRAAVSRLAVADARLSWQDPLPGETNAAQERRAAADAAGWLLLLAPGAVLHPKAIAWFQQSAMQTGAALLYSDEEHTVAGATGAEADRPDTLIARWSFDPEILLQANILGDSLGIRADLYRDWHRDPAIGYGGDGPSVVSFWRSALLLMARESAIDCAHIPYPLIGNRTEGLDTQNRRLLAHAAAVRQAVDRQGLPCQVRMPDAGDAQRLHVTWKAPDPGPPIAIIITTRNNALDCVTMVESLLAHARRPERIRCIVIDNGTDRDDDRVLLARLSDIPAVTLRRIDEAFNWSRLNNLGAELAEPVSGTILVFANDDMEMLTDDWDETLAGLLARPEVGAVGAKLLYPDRTIQHGGILFGWRGSVIHDGLHEPDNSTAQSMRWQLSRQVNAVTGAFLGPVST